MRVCKAMMCSATVELVPDHTQPSVKVRNKEDGLTSRVEYPMIPAPHGFCYYHAKKHLRLITDERTDIFNAIRLKMEEVEEDEEQDEYADLS